MREEIYSFGQDPWDEKGITFVLTGISYCDSTYKIGRVNSEVTVIEYIIEGEGTIDIDGKLYHPKKGDTYLLPQGSNHCYYPDPDKPWTKIWVNLSGQLVSDIINAYDFNSTILFENLYIGDLLEELVQNTKNHTPDLFLTSGKIIYEIFYRLHAYTNQSELNLDPNARALKDYINNHIFETITLTTLAELISKSEQHTIRIFKAAFGDTPYQYILNKKLEYAKLYLRNSGMSIRDVSSRLAFSDEFYFSNIFKKKTGLSPSEYRSQNHLQL